MVTSNSGRIKELSMQCGGQMRVACTISFKFKPAKTSLYGTMAAKCTVAIPGNNDVVVVNLSLPCMMGRAIGTYTGYDINEAKSIDYSLADTAYVRGLSHKSRLTCDELNNLGYCYLNGYGVSRDEAKALECFAAAREKGSLESYANLYLMYRNGLGCEKDFFQALECLNVGRKSLSVSALTLSADLMLSAPKSNAETALQWFNTAERAGDHYAIKRLGGMAKAGEGQAQRPDAAMGYFMRSKDKDAYYEQAAQLVKEKKWSAAFNVYKEGAQLGSQKCMQALSEMFLAGIGVRQDFRSAKRWKNKIAEAKLNQLKGYRHVE